MSYIIIQQPQSALLSTSQPQAANNDTYFTVSSSTTSVSGITDYKYTADIYVNTELVCTQKTFPDPNIKVGVFNLKNVTNSFIMAGNYTTDDDGIFYMQDGAIANVIVSFGEEYLLGGVFTSTKNLATSYDTIYVNASLEFTEAANNNLLNNVLNHGPNGVIPIWEYYNAQIAYINRPSFLISGTTHALVQTFDEYDNWIGSYLSKGNPFSAITSYQTVSADAVGFSTGTTANPDGDPDFFNENVKKYQISIIGLVNEANPWGDYHSLADSDVFELRENDCDTRNDVYQLSWLNRFGGYDLWRFSKKSQEKITKTQSEYQKVRGKLTDDGIFRTESTDRGNQVYYTSLQRTLSISSDFLSQDDVLFLRDLFSSPDIFLRNISQSTNSVSVTITDTDYILNKRVNKKLYALTLNLKMSYQDYRQLA